MWIISIDALILWKGNYVLNDDRLDHKNCVSYFWCSYRFRISFHLFVLLMLVLNSTFFFSTHSLHAANFQLQLLFKNRIVVNFSYFLIHSEFLWHIQIPTENFSQTWSKNNTNGIQMNKFLIPSLLLEVHDLYFDRETIFQSNVSKDIDK